MGFTDVSMQPQISEAEWGLIIELLEHERRELPAELHHTSSSALRQELQERKQMVDRLLERLRSKRPQPATA